MIFLALLNFGLLGNITATANLATNLAPKPFVSSVQTTNLEFSQQFLPQKEIANLSIQTTPDYKLRRVVTAPPKPAATTTQPAAKGGGLTIAKIGINNLKLAKSSVSTIADMDNKMLYYPTLEDKISPDLCSDYGNSYITGHSEPAMESQKNYPGVNVFSNLNLLQPGDIIQVTNGGGVSCKYQVTGWDKAVTGSKNQVSEDIFSMAYFPKDERPTLTIQTCQKGSATVRLLLRATKLVS